MTISFKTKILLLLLILPFLASCSKDPIGGDDDEPQIEARITEVIRYEKSRMTAYNIEYQSKDPLGKDVMLSGTITIGDEVGVGKPARGMVLYNRYTIFGAHECPSRGGLAMQKFIVGSGLITVSADGYGFGSTEDKPQAYCIGSANAQAGVDALLAARKLLSEKGYKWDNVLFNIGYSQGGQTSIAVLKLVTESYPSIRITHTFAGGGPYDLPATYRWMVSQNRSAMPCSVAESLLAYNTIFNLGIEWDRLFKEPLLGNFSEWILSKKYGSGSIDRKIGTEILSDIFTPETLDPQSSVGRVFLSAMQGENLCQGWTPRKDEQISIIHNVADDVVPVVNAQNLIDFFKDKGLPVTKVSSEKGVYVKVYDMKAEQELYGISAPHVAGAVPFLLTALSKICSVLNIDVWFDSSELTDQL